MMGMPSDFEALILRLLKDNPCEGYDKLHRELLKHAHRLGVTSTRIVLKSQQDIPGNVIHGNIREPITQVFYYG
jgi:hypothetical protein